MTVGEKTCLTPEVQRFSLFVVEEGHNAFLVVDIGLFAYEGSLHLVDRLLEEFLVLSDQQLLDVLQATFSLGDRVDLDALDEDLDERSGLRELRPCEW